MDPAQLLLQLKKSRPGPGYLFLGRELFSRDGCRKALIEAALSPEERASGLTEYDLAETSIDKVIEDARTLSLFSPRRVIAAYNAEAALPRGFDEDESAQSAPGSEDRLGAYFRDPTPNVVVLIEAVRFDWDDRDERRKLERLVRFFAAVPVKVEMRRLDARAALEGAHALARQCGLTISDALLAELVETLGCDMARIANEISKLAVYGFGRGPITRAELAALVPEARTSGLYELTDALAARDRTRALQILDTLTKMEVYLPLQVNFLASLFRYALAVKEAGARNTNDVMRLFERLGLPVWPGRARQALETAGRFSQRQLQEGLVLLFETDRDLRQERPDDRIVMERLVWALTRQPPAH